MYKKFDKSLYNAYDQKAKDTLIQHYTKNKKVVKENPKKYDIDLIVYNKDNSVNSYIEVEVKQAFSGAKFQYPDINIPSRKLKYFVGKTKPIKFVIFNKELTHFLFIKGTDILKSPLVEVSNKYIRQGEMFVKVPLNKIKIIKV